MKHLFACLAMTVAFFSSAQVGGFQLPYNPDAQPDGYIGASDVVELLTFYGQNFTPDGVYANDDSTHVLMDMGSMSYPECAYTCRHTLPGSWRLATVEDAGGALSQVKGSSAWINQDEFATDKNNYGHLVRHHWNADGTVEGDSDWDNQKGCFCATHQRPKVEYSYCEGTNIQNCSSNKVADGWYPLGITSHHRHPGEAWSGGNGSGYQWKVQAFWRWAD